jgi:Tfp pilus assembly protein PilE
MRILAITAIIALLTIPAYAQDSADPAKAEGNKAEADKKKKSEESEKLFQDAVKRIREPEQAAKKRDPWGNMR